MRRLDFKALLAATVLACTLGFFGWAAIPVAAQLQPGEGCAPEGDRFILGIVDPSEDGVISIADLRFIEAGLPAGAQKDQFARLIAQAEAQGVTGIRYNITGPCPPTATTVPPTATVRPPTATTVPPTATTVPPTATVRPPTATTVPPTATSTATPGPTAIATSTTQPTATATSQPTSTATPSATSQPTSTVTATTIPPTATATATSVPTLGTVINTGGDNLRCRLAPINGSVITSLAPGSQVQVRGPVANGWVPVRCGGQNGFVSAQYLSISGGSTPTVTPTATTPPGTAFGTVSNTGGDNLRCRVSPINGSVITSLAPGARVEVRGPVASGWYPVRCGGQNGWVSAQFLTVSSSPTPTPTVTPTPGASFGTVSNTGGDNLRCRTAPVNGAVIASLPPGARVDVRGPASNGWIPVRCANQNGFVSAQYLTVTGGSTPTVTPTPGTTVGYIDTAGGANANCRSQPNLSSAVITRLAFGSQVTIRGAASNGWTPVRCGNQDGWISSQLIVNAPPSGFGPGEVASSHATDA